MTTKFDLYQTVTDKIVASLESGVLPWVKPWDNKKGGSDYNLISGKEYRGINVILLGMAGFNSPVWATYKQWQEKGCNVKKGQSGSMIVYASKVESKDASAITETNPEGKKEFFMMKYSTVFNAEQVEGYEPESSGNNTEFNMIEACETVLKPWAHKITHQGNQAFYSPAHDAITMPPKEAFKTSAGYYSTAFHELSHLTGHESRLNRDFKNRFGTEAYAFEELIAELSSAFINHSCGLDSINNHDSYIASWLKVLKNDKKAIFTASTQAQKAADMVLAGE